MPASRCPSCGAGIDSSDEFCSTCGETLVPSTISKPNSDTPPTLAPLVPAITEPVAVIDAHKPEPVKSEDANTPRQVRAPQSTALSASPQEHERTDRISAQRSPRQSQPAVGIAILLGILLSVCAGALLYFFQAQAAHVSVPSLGGMTSEQAQHKLLTAKLRNGTVTEEYSDSVPEGVTIKQNPTAGSTVSVNASVDYVVSKGVQLPDPPANLHAIELGPHAVQLNWEAAARADSYQVTRTDSSGNSTTISTDIKETTFTDKDDDYDLQENQAYSYMVASVNATGTSDGQSVLITIENPEAPTPPAPTPAVGNADTPPPSDNTAPTQSTTATGSAQVASPPEPPSIQGVLRELGFTVAIPNGWVLRDNSTSGAVTTYECTKGNCYFRVDIFPSEIADLHKYPDGKDVEWQKHSDVDKYKCNSLGPSVLKRPSAVTLTGVSWDFERLTNGVLCDAHADYFNWNGRSYAVLTRAPHTEAPPTDDTTVELAKMQEGYDVY